MAALTIFGQVAIGTVLLLAGLSKAIDPASMRAFIGEFKVPPFAARVAVPVVIASELAAGLSLVSGWQVIAGAVLSTFLSFGFVSTLLLARARRSAISCGCFGPFDGGQPQWLQIARAALMLLGAGVVLAQTTAFTAGSHHQFYDVAYTTRILGAASGVAFATVFVLIGQILVFERGRRAVLVSLSDQHVSSTKTVFEAEQ